MNEIPLGDDGRRLDFKEILLSFLQTPGIPSRILFDQYRDSVALVVDLSESELSSLRFRSRIFVWATTGVDALMPEGYIGVRLLKTRFCIAIYSPFCFSGSFC